MKKNNLPILYYYVKSISLCSDWKEPKFMFISSIKSV